MNLYRCAMSKQSHTPGEEYEVNVYRRTMSKQADTVPSSPGPACSAAMTSSMISGSSSGSSPWMQGLTLVHVRAQLEQLQDTVMR